MDLSPDSCKAGMFGLYYLIRDVFVAVAALGGAFLWQISPETNLITAFFFGVVGTVGFVVWGRDMPVPIRQQGYTVTSRKEAGTASRRVSCRREKLVRGRFQSHHHQ